MDINKEAEQLILDMRQISNYGTNWNYPKDTEKAKKLILQSFERVAEDAWEDGYIIIDLGSTDTFEDYWNSLIDN